MCQTAVLWRHLSNMELILRFSFNKPLFDLKGKINLWSFSNPHPRVPTVLSSDFQVWRFWVDFSKWGTVLFLVCSLVSHISNMQCFYLEFAYSRVKTDAFKMLIWYSVYLVWQYENVSFPTVSQFVLCVYCEYIHVFQLDLGFFFF